MIGKRMVALWLAVLMAGAQSALAAPQPEATRVAADAPLDDYRLGVGDKLRIIVFQEDSLTGEYQIGSNGKLSFPLVGEIDVHGHTTSELASNLRGLLVGGGYLRNPRVSVEVLTYRPYFILGEVKSPAQYPYVNGMTVLNAVAMAGGFTTRAERRKVFIRRAGEDRELRYALTPSLRIYPGDTLRLGERLF